ncbi:hypothetical protein [Kytococcus sp. Marseille-QA3725]
MVTADTQGAEATRAVLAVLPGHLAASHITAARFHGIPLPTEWTRDEPVHVSTRPPRRAPQRRGVRGHQDARLDVVEVGGVRCASLTSTWRGLTSLLQAHDLTAAADWLIGRTCPLAGRLTAADLAQCLSPGARGTSRGRASLVVADGAARSPKESHLRHLVLSWGLPTPEVNADVHDEEGQWLGCSDLVWRSRKVVAEYEGDHHRTDRRQWQHDIERIRLYEAAGWKVVRATSRDLTRPARLREALERALAGHPAPGG